jgi:hypothetical protein
MEIHRLISLGRERRLNETRTTSFDLNPAASLLLDMLYVRALWANHLGSQVESVDWLKVNWNILLRPFAPAILIKFHLFRLAPTTESAFINKVRQVLGD